jgi:hypothetical protein
MRPDIEKAFAATSGVILGRPLSGLADYAQWLERHTLKAIRRKSALSSSPTWIPDMLYNKGIMHRMAEEGEALALGARSIRREELDSLTISNAGKKLMEIKTITANCSVGQNPGMEECALCGDSSNCYKSAACMKAKCCAFSFWPRQSEYAFGCSYLFSSKFCINCYYSLGLTRCFEMSDCTNCSDCYFCNNCEGLQHCMFCSGVKSLKYAIANQEVGKEKYAEVKKLALERICAELERKKDFRIDIYNLGCPNSQS